MMKPGVGTYDRFKELFDRYSKEAGKEQYLIPYFIAAHPGTRDEDMLELALWLKRNGFRADQVQAFLPSPMATATAMYHSGKNPLHKVTRRREEVVHPEGHRASAGCTRRSCATTTPNNWPLLREALRQMGRSDLIGNGWQQLVPTYQPIGTGRAHEGKRKAGAAATAPERATVPDAAHRAAARPDERAAPTPGTRAQTGQVAGNSSTAVARIAAAQPAAAPGHRRCRAAPVLRGNRATCCPQTSARRHRLSTSSTSTASAGAPATCSANPRCCISLRPGAASVPPARRNCAGLRAGAATKWHVVMIGLDWQDADELRAYATRHRLPVPVLVGDSGHRSRVPRSRISDLLRDRCAGSGRPPRLRLQFGAWPVAQDAGLAGPRRRVDLT